MEWSRSVNVLHRILLQITRERKNEMWKNKKYCYFFINDIKIYFNKIKKWELHKHFLYCFKLNYNRTFAEDQNLIIKTNYYDRRVYWGLPRTFWVSTFVESSTLDSYLRRLPSCKIIEEDYLLVVHLLAGKRLDCCNICLLGSRVLNV